MPDERERVYVLRLWDEADASPSHRISLYDALSGERRYFGTPRALLAHLSAKLDSGASGPDDNPHTPHLRS